MVPQSEQQALVHVVHQLFNKLALRMSQLVRTSRQQALLHGCKQFGYKTVRESLVQDRRRLAQTLAEG